MVAVGAHKADRVGWAREEIRTSGLQSRQIAGFDLQRRGDVVQIEAERLSLLTQQISGGSRTKRERGFAVRQILHEGGLETPQQGHAVIPPQTTLII